MESISLSEESIRSKQDAATSTQARLIPSYVYATVFASLSIVVGLLWDISWHMSIGRDGLFSPPHLGMYLGAVIAGCFSGFKVLKISFWGTAEEKASSVKFWGIFHGSLGAMFCIWGAFAMLTSAPFDDWWHNTYGLDVTILSPPHTVLALGMVTIQFGAMVSVLALQNRFKQTDNNIVKQRLRWLYALSAGFLLVMVYTIASEYFGRHNMHEVFFYQLGMLLFPLFIVPIAFASPAKWGATSMTVVYSITMMFMVWILPLFPAEPLLGPIYNHITTFQPYHFPLLLIFPALAIDFIIGRWRHKNKWLLALLISIGFLLVFFPVQWFMGDFLMSPYARNWFFGQESWFYAANPDYEYRYAFAPWQISTGWNLVQGLLIAAALGILSSRLGLSWGNWMKQIQR
ncbi:MAG TPA: hypothetical protein PKC24_06770 [Cyclobacteriaceae bacterium]|nr:hypothetical protein [Cyclobacteriaceae bacterium]